MAQYPEYIQVNVIFIFKYFSVSYRLNLKILQGRKNIIIFLKFQDSFFGPQLIKVCLSTKSPEEELEEFETKVDIEAKHEYKLDPELLAKVARMREERKNHPEPLKKADDEDSDVSPSDEEEETLR